MGLVLEQIKTEGLAQLSYLIGDDKLGEAAVIDPRRDIDIYLRLAREQGLRITHIVETHIHADFVSGSHELRARTGATIYGGKTDDYQFEMQQLQEGDEIHMGKISLRALHTPGHTPEHISLLVADAQQGTEPFGIFTGDFVFNLDVGRPDLLGTGMSQKLAKNLYNSLFNKFIPLGDRLEVYPCHGAGSACGKSIGDRRQSTIGNERLYNPAFQDRSQEDFVEWLLADMPEPPAHYARLKKVNAEGAPILCDVPTLPPLSPQDFQKRLKDNNTQIIDTRSILAFAGGHIANALNIAWGESFATWAGWMLDPNCSYLLILESNEQVDAVTRQLFRLGYDNLSGYLHHGMTSWQNAGLPLEKVGIWTVHTLNDYRNNETLTVLDVRSDQEYEKGRVPGAKHIFLPHLEENLDELEKSDAIATYCGSGYRASIAASLLQRHGFTNVINIPGSWKAWQASDLPIETPPELAAV